MHALLFAAAIAAGGVGIGAQVGFDRLLNAAREPQNWLTYSGDVSGKRYSPLTSITPGNVKNLQLEWVLQTTSPAEATQKYEASPIVVDGVMYTVQPPNVIVALDATTGRVFWSYPYTPAATARNCCGRVNRGLALLGHTLFMGTFDGNLIAIDARDGRLLWTTALGRPEAGYAVTGAPLVVKDKVITGPAGGEYGISGFLAAYDAATGREVWRFNTVPHPGEPGHDSWSGDAWKTGGGSIWNAGTYDPGTNTVFWGIGNPGPDWNGAMRPGDNLYTGSVIALDADTGKLKWHYQFTPHDEFDFDATQIPVLAEIPWEGRQRRVLMTANRNGIFYVLDRDTGRFLLGKAFVKVTWMSGFDEAGRPIRVQTVTEDGIRVYPENQGGTNWYPPSFSPRTGLFYIPTWVDTYSINTRRADTYVAGNQFNGGGATHNVPALTASRTNQRSSEVGYGAITAVDPRTGEIRWQFKMADVTDSGVLSTASDLVFAGGREGYFYALDAKTGAVLWRQMLGGQIANGPVAYAVDGRQFISVAAGNAVFTFALRPSS
ncbi:MAG: PQQ-dependent dehydrogenase, methanol/ethanol family [Acidobacteriota bacterium]